MLFLRHNVDKAVTFMSNRSTSNSLEIAGYDHPIYFRDA